MNLISINLKHGESIDLHDTEDTPKEDLLEMLSSLFSANNVAILHTEKTSVIIRPSDLSTITLTDVDEVKETVPKLKDSLIPSPVITKKVKSKSKSEDHVDIITDAE